MNLQHFATQADFPPPLNPCPRCRLKGHMERLRRTLNESSPLDQVSYKRLHELLVHYDKHPSITVDLVHEAREEIHRLNLKKVRYEDLVEAHESNETRLSKEEMEELLELLRVFDDGNAGMRLGVVRMVEVRTRKEEARRKEREEKRKGIIGMSPGLIEAMNDKEADGDENLRKKAESGRSSWF